MPIINIEGRSDVVKEAVADADAHTTNVGLPAYSQVLLALEQIARLGREGTRNGHIIRDAMTEIAEKALA